ncbi:hypothetical protein ACFSZS_12680 [Seohaeicola zhoushanensis]
MVSLRLWVTGRLVVSVQRRQVRAVGDLIEACQRGAGPSAPATWWRGWRCGWRIGPSRWWPS